MGESILGSILMGGYNTPVMENQMDKKIGNEMETAIPSRRVM